MKGPRFILLGSCIYNFFIFMIFMFNPNHVEMQLLYKKVLSKISWFRFVDWGAHQFLYLDRSSIEVRISIHDHHYIYYFYCWIYIFDFISLDSYWWTIMLRYYYFLYDFSICICCMLICMYVSDWWYDYMDMIYLIWSHCKSELIW